MEDIVEHLLPLLLKEFPHQCTCSRCMDDIKALALNNLKPYYVATEKGEVYSKLNRMSAQFETDVMKAIVDAICIVSKNPKH